MTPTEMGTAFLCPPEQRAAEGQSCPRAIKSTVAFPWMTLRHARGCSRRVLPGPGVLPRNPMSPGLPAGTLLPGPVPKRDTPPPSIGKHAGTGRDRYPSVPATLCRRDSASGVGGVWGCPNPPARLGGLQSRRAGQPPPPGIASLALGTAVGCRESRAGCIDAGQAGVSPGLSLAGAGGPPDTRRSFAAVGSIAGASTHSERKAPTHAPTAVGGLGTGPASHPAL